MNDFARLRPLISTTSIDIRATLQALLAHLENVDVVGGIRITLLSESERQKWDLDLNTKQLVAIENEKRQAARQDADLELIMSTTTWMEIAMGRLPPLEAFRAGKLRLRGDAEFANKLYEGLKDNAGGITRICG